MKIESFCLVFKNFFLIGHSASLAEPKTREDFMKCEYHILAIIMNFFLINPSTITCMTGK